jgi:pyruvate formate lyase activating enzyme
VGLSTAVETCGFADTDTLLEAAPYTDLFLWDLKDTDSTRHRQYTGVSNEVILKNLMAVNDTFAHIRLRCILVNGINTNKAHYTSIAEIARRIHNLDGVEFIPYHAYGGAKATLLGDEDNGRKEWIPEAEEPKRAQRTLRDLGVTVL